MVVVKLYRRKMNFFKCSVLVFVTLFCAYSCGIKIETVKYCCGLGTNYAKSGLKCTSFQVPIAGVLQEDENSCLHSIDVCCKNSYREVQCEKGKEDATTGKTCAANEGTTDVKKECCEACEIGRDTGKSGQACQDSLGLGAPFDGVFVACCKEVNPSTTVSSTTATSINPLTAKPKPTTPNSYDPLPPFENFCDIGEICAQICIPTGDSYRCDCNKGFSLMEDGISCKPNQKSGSKNDRCDTDNPCDHDCTDTGVAITCSCREGYILQNDKRTCKDIDECAKGVSDCGNGVCVNEDGGYYCEYDDLDSTADFDKCPAGYKFNGQKQVCDDIDECEFPLMCERPKTCINTVGSFRCEGEDIPQCPPGFYYKAADDTCIDIDECVTGENDCNKESQDCLNTKGNYTCIDKVSKKTCPPGFKKNPYTQMCEDINECEENSELCKKDEVCVNENGGHTCAPKQRGTQSSEIPLKSTPKIQNTSPSTTTTTTKKPVSCSMGYRFSKKDNRCIDIDECKEDEMACDSTQDCKNIPGSFLCNCKIGFIKDTHTGACVDLNECQVGSHDCTIAQRCDNTVGSYLCSRIQGCGTGYTLNYANGLCEDDDECLLGSHNCNDLGPNFRCKNTVGSYRCERIPTQPNYRPKINNPVIVRPSPSIPSSSVFYLPQTTPIYRVGPQYVLQTPNKPPVQYPVYSNQPPITPFKPSPSPQQYYPSLPSSSPTTITTPPNYSYPRVPFNTYTQQVYHPRFTPSYVPSPPKLYPIPPPKTTYPPYPIPTNNYPIISGQLRKCLPGYKKNSKGECEDIDECESNPCRKGQKCINYNGSFQCKAGLQCKYGYELDDSGENCVDVNECARGTHKCGPTQICKNGPGYHTCECPPGHYYESSIRERCIDIDECKKDFCNRNADCINTPGSYKCRCKAGFKGDGKYCSDVDECMETSRLCDHKCVNTWGSYRCACQPGFTLNFDNRTCMDVDECEKFKDKKLCIGTCHNVPGSYVCKCPKGYKLGNDGRICRDINECEHNVCPRADDICLNTHGGYKCFQLTCPANYYRDPSHKSRCKKAHTLCDARDLECMQLPDQFTSHYLSFVSNLPVDQGPISFFHITGPKWQTARAEFKMYLEYVNCPSSVSRITDRNFRINHVGVNSMKLDIVRSLQGPQDIKIVVKMNLYHGQVITNHVVFNIYVVISEHEY